MKHPAFKSKKVFLGALLMAVSLSASAYRSGDTVDAEILKKLKINPDKITLVDFFASWCTSCKKELPLLDNMKLDAEKVEIMGVCTDEDIKKGKAFQKKLNLKMRVFDDTNQSVVSAFSPFGMPALYYIQNGKVIKVRQGAIPAIDKKVAADLKKIK